MTRESSSELNFTGVNVPITKHIFTITNVDEIQMIIQQAVQVAAEGRPGPVIVEITDGVLAQPTLLSCFDLPNPKPAEACKNGKR
ncbi:hypothetical protein [Bacillus sp. T3]|uniref:hypothetical protein n=1 Tax=Bacillus sp. T3 TaxID=467262 RepID=UPI00399155E2